MFSITSTRRTPLSDGYFSLSRRVPVFRDFTVFNFLSFSAGAYSMVSAYSRGGAYINTVKIRDSDLGLSGFVSFFMQAYLRGGLSMEKI